ncbi:GEVED domain-containing protein [Spirosoma telluris]|uniref:GEVED domain-containing protein n=1 Tax=Spirosoma telluris TaxID=2183553 RepID=UPI002FC30B15
MSYYFPCTSDFTPDQYDRMQAALALRQSHTAYTLDYPPTVVAAPSNVVATVEMNQVILNWQDNGTNEMGYFIERSTSPVSGFVMIGGVGPDATTFTDTQISSLTTYYYRIKPSNSTTGSTSPTISITTNACHPSFTYACLYPVGIASLAINNVLLSQNSGCSPNGYGVFSTSTTVQAGLSYPVSGTLLYAPYTQGVTIWADLNRNGSFETDQGERLFQTPTTITGQFSGSLTLPVSLTAGALPIRVVTVFAAVPTNPCGAYSYGEAEDYILTIINPADLSLSLQTNTRTPAINEPVSYSLTMRNDGPFNATGIQWQNRLPTGLTFASGGTDVIGSSTAVSGTTSFSLGANQSVTVIYQLQATQPGIYINSAQIISSDQVDPDSQPDSGTGDGQDDEASVDIRTVSSTTAVLTEVYTSPNPNQTPLPAVLSNQPAPNPVKADLSLALVLNTHTARVGQPVTVTITISNAGSLAASNTVVRDTLRGFTFSSSPTGMSVVTSSSGYTIIEGTVASLTAGSSAQLIFTAIPIAVGSLQNAAQIWSTTIEDPDSTPGSITPAANNLNGEDDVAWIDLRVDP